LHHSSGHFIGAAAVAAACFRTHCTAQVRSAHEWTGNDAAAAAAAAAVVNSSHTAVLARRIIMQRSASHGHACSAR